MTVLLRVEAHLVRGAEYTKYRKATGSQDDGFVAGLKYSWLGMQKTRKIEKVTASQDDGFVWELAR